MLVVVGHVITAPASHLIANSLVNRFSVPKLSDDDFIDGIIALGGGSDRLEEAVRLAQQLPKTKLLVSGVHPTEFELVRRLINNDERLLLEPNARNTSENAINSAVLLRSADSRRWLLVTSALHMPRAIGAFRKAGLDLIPWPLQDLQVGGFDLLAMAMHEWIGLVGYRLLGKTDALLPGPAPPGTAAAGPVSVSGRGLELP